MKTKALEDRLLMKGDPRGPLAGAGKVVGGAVKSAGRTVTARASRNPAGAFYVETGSKVVGPYQTKGAADRRTAAETKAFKGGKVPEETFKPRGSSAVARFPDGRPVPRQSPGKR